jgi:hypothetical protein
MTPGLCSKLGEHGPRGAIRSHYHPQSRYSLHRICFGITWLRSSDRVVFTIGFMRLWRPFAAWEEERFASKRDNTIDS